MTVSPSEPSGEVVNKDESKVGFTPSSLQQKQKYNEPSGENVNIDVQSDEGLDVGSEEEKRTVEELFW